jgi:hypothetical protein
MRRMGHLSMQFTRSGTGIQQIEAFAKQEPADG